MTFIAVAAVAGYAGNAVASRTAHTDWNSQPEQAVFTYLGHPIHCLVSEDGAKAGNIGGLSCDFVRYWRGRR